MSTAATVARVLDLTRSRPPTLGSGRLVCVDGPAGSGKTTLGGEIATASGAPVLHTDDFLRGWDGLPGLAADVEPFLARLAADEAARYRPWDWIGSRPGREVVVRPAPLLVLEGVGAGHRAWAAWCTVLVWIEADHDVRMRRGLERDGEAFAPHWRDWARAEQLLFAADETRTRADVLLRT